MKRVKSLILSLTLCVVWLSASSDTGPGTRYTYTPYFMKLSELRQSVSYSPGKRDMRDPGKICVRGSEIFVVERYKGVHIIDNSTKELTQTGFIIAPGCMDVAVKGNIIYLDNAIDLVAFDLDAKEVTERIERFFPEPLSPDGSGRYSGTPSGMIRVGWTKVTHSK